MGAGKAKVDVRRYWAMSEGTVVGTEGGVWAEAAWGERAAPATRTAASVLTLDGLGSMAAGRGNGSGGQERDGRRSRRRWLDAKGRGAMNEVG